MADIPESTKMLPCPNPWCENIRGVEAARHITTKKWHICCGDCLIDGPWADTCDLAIAAWNTRAAPPAPIAEGVTCVAKPLTEEERKAAIDKWMAPPAMDREAVGIAQREIDALRYLLNWGGTGKRVSSVMKTFTLNGDERSYTKDALESLWSKLSTLSADAIRQGEGGDPVETRFWSIVDGAGLAAVPSDMWAALDVIARKSGHYDKLVRALHDAIMSPKGVVPDSADPYYRSSLCLPATPASHASDGGKA